MFSSPPHRVGRVLSFFSSRRNWDSPNHSSAGECAPPRFWGEGHTRWRERGWESTNFDEETSTVVLFIYTYFVITTIRQRQWPGHVLLYYILKQGLERTTLRRFHFSLCFQRSRVSIKCEFYFRNNMTKMYKIQGASI
jgi:hypothetical protein